jgi:hypothetical protein
MGFISDGKFQLYRVHLVPVQQLPFQEKGEVVEAERYRILKYQQPLALSTGTPMSMSLVAFSLSKSSDCVGATST